MYSLLLIEYVAATAAGNSAERALERKDKRPLPIPVELIPIPMEHGHLLIVIGVVLLLEIPAN